MRKLPRLPRKFFVAHMGGKAAHEVVVTPLSRVASRKLRFIDGIHVCLHLVVVPHRVVIGDRDKVEFIPCPKELLPFGRGERSLLLLDAVYGMTGAKPLLIESTVVRRTLIDAHGIYSTVQHVRLTRRVTSRQHSRPQQQIEQFPHYAAKIMKKYGIGMRYEEINLKKDKEDCCCKQPVPDF